MLSIIIYNLVLLLVICYDSFYFSSEIKAIHAAGIKKKPNEEIWASYFAYGSYGMPDESFWEDIHQLPGGHYLELKNRRSGTTEDLSIETLKQRFLTN